MKGLRGSEIKEETDRMLKSLDIEDKQGTRVKDLSGGMKRKLSISCALCGHSKVGKAILKGLKITMVRSFLNGVRFLNLLCHILIIEKYITK